MNTIKDKLWHIALLTGILFSTGIHAAGEITWVKYGWQAFRNSGDATSLALGGALTAYSNSAASFLHNPAHIQVSQNRPFVYAHQNRFSGVVNSDLFSMKFKQNTPHPIGLTILHEGVSNIFDTRSSLLDWGEDGIPGTGDNGEGNGILDEGERLDSNKLKQFSQNQWAFNFNTGWTVGSMQLGLSAKGLVHFLGEHTGSGLGFDVGMTTDMFPKTKIGVTVYDIMTSWVIWDNGTKEITSPSVALGVTREVAFSSFPVGIAMMGDILIYSEGITPDDDVQIGNIGGILRVGTEIKINNQIAIRIGRNGKGNASAGLGIQWDQIEINYAYQISTMDSGLGDNHYVSFSINPKWLWKTIADNL